MVIRAARAWIAGPLLASVVVVSAATAQNTGVPAASPTPQPVPAGASPAPAGQITTVPAPPGPATPTVAPQLPVAATPPPGSIEAVNRANSELVVTLLRNTLAALGHANQTGNYTVLRDLGAPDFSARNSATDLAGIFAVLRSAKIDLAPVVLLDPQISRASLTSDQKLYIKGALATKPLPVTFEVMFEPVNGNWRLEGLSITPVQDLSAPQAAPSALLPRTTAAAPALHNRPKSKHKSKPDVTPAAEPARSPD